MDRQAAFDELYLASRDRLVRQLTALTGDPADAQDLVQEAFVRAWLRWDRVGAYEDPEGWVRRVAHNLAVSRWRRARHVVLRPRVAVADVGPAPGEELTLTAALRALPRKERQAIVLRYVAGMSVVEVAAEMRAPEGTVKSWLSRGRARLAAVLGRLPGGAPVVEEVDDDE